MRTEEAKRNNRLKPFGYLYVGLEMAIDGYLRSKSLDELKQLSEDCSAVTTGNCWFATYRVSPFLLEQIKQEIKLREEANHD